MGRVAFGAGSGGFKPSWTRTAAISGSNFTTRNQTGSGYSFHRKIRR
jgi:hypothetical protein